MVKLRRFKISDLDRVMEIEKLSFPSGAWTKEYFIKICRKNPEGFIVAESKKEVIGYGVGEIKQKSLGLIASLGVLPSWYRKKVGTKLLNYLASFLKNKGVKTIIVYVWNKNRKAMSFYQSLGFKKIKLIKRFFRDGDDAYLMKM